MYEWRNNWKTVVEYGNIMMYHLVLWHTRLSTTYQKCTSAIIILYCHALSNIISNTVLFSISTVQIDKTIPSCIVSAVVKITDSSSPASVTLFWVGTFLMQLYKPKGCNKGNKAPLENKKGQDSSGWIRHKEFDCLLWQRSANSSNKATITLESLIPPRKQVMWTPIKINKSIWTSPLSGYRAPEDQTDLDWFVLWQKVNDI